MTETKQIAFWDRVADRYAARPVRDVAAFEDMLNDVTARLRPTDRVLEIGCGTGSTAVRLGGGVASWLATDISPEMHRIAQAKDAPASVRFALARAETRHADAPFDAVCAFHILHLVPDSAATLAALYDQLAPGGLLISKTWCLADLNLAMKALLPLLRLRGWMPPTRSLKRAQVVAMIEEAGFVIEDTRHFGTQKQSLYIVARKPG